MYIITCNKVTLQWRNIVKLLCGLFIRKITFHFTVTNDLSVRYKTECLLRLKLV